MAKIRRYKLTWEVSRSKNITGYKIYWSNSESINYDSKSIDVGNVTEVILSSDITSSGNMVMFGVVAIDRDGNESDITRMEKPYQFHIPNAPERLSLRPMDDFKIVSMTKPQFKNPPHSNHIRKRMQHQGICWKPVPTCTSGLLEIFFHVGWQIQVSDETSIRLIDTHAESDGGNYYTRVVFLKPFLIFKPDV